MKGKILIVVLLLSSILAGLIESYVYAAEARATASVLIIIPPREEEVEKKIVEMPLKEKNASGEREVITVKDNRKD